MSTLEEKQTAYGVLFGKPVPPRFKNDEAWIDAKLVEKTESGEPKGEDVPPPAETTEEPAEAVEPEGEEPVEDDLTVEDVSVPKRKPSVNKTQELIKASGWELKFVPIKIMNKDGISHDERRHCPWIAIEPGGTHQKTRNYNFGSQCFQKREYAERFILDQIGA